MKSTDLTQGISLLILTLYILYGLFALPFAGLLTSLAVGLIAFGTLENTELTVATIILTGVLYYLIARSGAVTYMGKTKEGFSTDGGVQISKRVERIYKANVEPNGVYASAFVEGFADATNNGTVAPPAPEQTGIGAGASPNSVPASSTAASTAGSGIQPPAPPAVTEQVHQAQTQASGFRGDSGASGEFKLGVLPDENKDSYHIDQGTTVLNALNSLKPDQLKAMTVDTQKLIDTQKQLMGLLGTMKPMIQDGKQMLETFQTMFGNNTDQFKL